MAKYIVRKPFGGPGGIEFKSGDVIDFEGRNTASLISLRFIELAPAEAVVDTIPVNPRAPRKQKD